jgi:hypothetical protein
MRFKTWLFAVDQVLVKELGLDSDSLEDYNWRDEFNRGVPAFEAAMEFIEETRSS